MNGVDIAGLRQRVHQRHEDDDGRYRLDEITDHGEQQHQQQHHQMRIVAGEQDDPVGDHGGAAQISQHPAECVGGADRDQRQRKDQPGEAEIIGDVLEVPAVERGDHHRDDPDHRDDAGFGRREGAGQDAAEQDDGDHQRQGSVARREHDLAQRRARPLHPRRPEEEAIDHQAEADHQPGHDAGHKEACNRDVAHRAVDHGGNARRHQRRDGGSSRNDRGDESGAVALLLHRTAQRAGHHGDVGGGGARHFREEHREHDHDLRQPTPDMPDQRQRQVRYSHHHVGRAHEFADQEKERNRQQRFGIHTVENLLHDRGERNIGQQRADEDACHQRKRHRHAEIAEEQEAERHQAENDGCTHGCTLFWMPVSTGGRSPVSSSGSGWSKPLRIPLTSCSTVNIPNSAPDSGIAA